MPNFEDKKFALNIKGKNYANKSEVSNINLRKDFKIFEKYLKM